MNSLKCVKLSRNNWTKKQGQIINDAVCNKELVSPFLVRHGHNNNNVFVFDSQVYSGGDNIPLGTVDAKKILKGFELSNKTRDSSWIYMIIEDTVRTFESL